MLNNQKYITRIKWEDFVTVWWPPRGYEFVIDGDLQKVIVYQTEG